MFEAARVTDGIEHSSALTGFLVGAALGIALIATVAFCTFTCGFGVALLAGFAAGIGAQALLSAGEAIGSAIKSTSGAIVTGSPNVFTNSLAAAIAQTSTAACSKHPPPPLVAEGSATVFINGKAAARKADHVTCGAQIGSGSGNVFIGGGTQKVLPFASEIPDWLRTATDWAFTLAGLAGGLAGMIRKAGTLSLRALTPCAAKYIAGFAIGEAVGRYVIGPAISGLVGNPVDLSSGRKILLAQDETDFVLNARLPLTCSRFYASNLQWDGMLGRGWMHEWDVHLRREDDQIIHVDAQGRETSFPLVAPGQKIFSPAEQRWLCCSEDGRYFIQGMDEIYYEFEPLPAAPGACALLRSIEDQLGQRITFERDAGGRLHTVRGNAGEHLRLHYAPAHEGAARMSAIELLAGGTPGLLVRYDYDANGQLVGVTNRAGDMVRRFAYADGLMVEHLNAAGLACRYQWQWIVGQPRVVAHQTSDGESWTFTYGERSSSATNTFGHTAHWQFDTQFQVIEHSGFDGAQYRFEYDDNGNPLSLCLPGNRSAHFVWDELGRLVQETDSLGRITRTAYHAASLRSASQTLPDGSQWQAHYDERGLLLATIDPLQRKTFYHWQENGLLERIVDAAGGSKSVTWNERGQIAAWRDCSGKTTRYGWDENGYLSAVTDALGHTTRFTHTVLGAQNLIMHPDGEQECFDYDAMGLLRCHTDARGLRRTWEYDARGQITRATGFDQRSQHCRYDAHGRLLELANGNGATYRFEYDALDRLQHQISVDGVETRCAYDDAGALVETTEIGQQPDGTRIPRIAVMQRDAMGRLLAHQSESATTAYEYDALDRVRCLTRQPTACGIAQGILPDTLRFEYDLAGQLLREEGVNGTLVSEYDALGNLASLTLPQGQTMAWLRYGSGHTHQISLDQQPICDIERDDLHREILRTQGHLQARFGYDQRGRRAWQNAMLASDAGAAAHGAHATDALAPTHPHTPPTPQGHLWRSYRYGPHNELIARHDSLRGPSQFQYDPEGRMLTASGALHVLEQFIWDAADNLQSRQGGQASAGLIHNNRLLVWQDIRYTWDAFGNVQTKSKGAWQHQTFVHDADNRLLEVSGSTREGDATTRFAYDSLGRRIGKTVLRANGRTVTTRFVWHGMQMLQEITPDQVSTHVYDPDQAWTPLARIDQALLADGQLDPAKSAERYWFHTDQIGTPLEVTHADGSLVWAGDYSAWGKLNGQVAQAIPQMDKRITQNLRFAGQYADASTGLHYNTFRFYDPDIGRFLSQDPIGLAGGINLYQYAPNPTGWIDPLGWDWNYFLTNSAGDVYYHGRASDNASIADVVRRHAKTTGSDGARFGNGDTLNQITPKGTPKLTVQGIEGIGVQETGTIGRRNINGNKVRGNNIQGINSKLGKSQAKINAGEGYLNGKNPSKMPALAKYPQPSPKKAC